MLIPSYAQLRKWREDRGFPWFLGSFDLNCIIGRSGKVGLWDDFSLWAFTDDAGRELVEAYPATSEAWAGEFLDPTHRDGCLYIRNDQHVVGGFGPGLFHGRQVLRQRSDAPFLYSRWPKSAQRIPSVAELEARPSFSAVRGSHLHDRCNGKTPDVPATNDSEGCVVHLYRHHHHAVLELGNQQKIRHGTARVSPSFGALADMVSL